MNKSLTRELWQGRQEWIDEAGLSNEDPLDATAYSDAVDETKDQLHEADRDLDLMRNLPWAVKGLICRSAILRLDAHLEAITDEEEHDQDAWDKFYQIDQETNDLFGDELYELECDVDQVNAAVGRLSDTLDRLVANLKID